MDPAPTIASPTPAAPMPPKRRRRWLRRLFFAAFSVLLLIAVAPHAIALSSVREKIETAIGDELGVRCHIDRLGFSWFSGIAAEGLELANPIGFPADHPMLSLRRFEGDLNLAQAVRGRFSLRGELVGMQVFVDQRTDGSTNFDVLTGDAGRTRSSGPSPTGGNQRGSGPASPPGPVDLARLKLALQVRESQVEIRRDGKLLEALTDLSCTIEKPFGSQHLTFELDTRLLPILASSPAGHLSVKADGDLTQETATARLSATGLDLQRWRPLIDAFAPGGLTALSGLANGTITLTSDGKTFACTGELAIDNPNLAGPLVGDLNLQAPKWRLQPTLTVTTKADGTRIVDAKGFSLSLGFAEVTAMPSEQVIGWLHDEAGLGLTTALDLREVAKLVPSLPNWLSNPSGSVLVSLALPLDAFDSSQRPWLERLRADLRSTNKPGHIGLTIAGFPLSVMASGALQNGTLTLELGDLQPPPAGNEAPAKKKPEAVLFGTRIDLRAGQRLASELTLRMPDQSLRGSTTDALRYLIPVLAGLDQTSDLSGRGNFEARLTGPLQRTGPQTWLQLFDEWTGNGTAGLTQASFTPIPALRGLLQPLGAFAALGESANTALGKSGKLEISSLSMPWTLRQSTITTTAGQWLSKGQVIGLSGTARLDGTLDYGVDLSALLKGHRDGERVLQALGGNLPLAKLNGSVAAPSLAMPDLGTVARNVLQNGLEKEGANVLRRALDDLLKKR